MEHLIFLYYFIGLFPGLGAGALAWAFSLGHQSPLSKKFLQLFSLMMVYFTQMVVVYYFIHISGNDPLLVESWSQPLYLLIYSFYPILAVRFFLELLQIPEKGWLQNLSRGLSALGIGMLFAILLFYSGFQERIDAFRFWVQFIYIPLFLALLSFLVGLQFIRVKLITDPWKKTTVWVSNLLILAFFPLFILDAFWPVLQMKFRIIPEGFNFFGIFFMAYSLFFFFRWRILLKDVADKTVKESPSILPDSQRLKALNLTDREAQVLLLVFDGRGNQEIADSLKVSLGTIKNHIYHIFQKSGASSRRELLAMLEG